MRIIKIPVNYYQQFDADYTLDVPAEGYGGWKKTVLDFDMDRTAVVLMHATDYGPREEVEGVYRACQYIPRANDISENIMPGLLKTIRNGGVKLFHLASNEQKCLNYAGYEKTRVLPRTNFFQVEQDDAVKRLRQFKYDNGFPGKHNRPGYDNSAKYGGFPKNEEPLNDEEIFIDEMQLAEYCKREKISHLIYIGYNIDWCILFAPGGIFHVSRHGIMCSAIRQAVTACESKETARVNGSRENSLWQIAVGFGFVFDLDDFINAIEYAS